MNLHSKKDFLNDIKHFYNGAKQESVKYKNATGPKCPFSSVSFFIRHTYKKQQKGTEGHTS